MAQIPEEQEEVEEGAPAWMATFSDLCTLLLTFFVLLLSFANMDIVHFREMAGSVREAFGVRWTDPGPYEAESSSVVPLGEGGTPETGPSAHLRRRRDRRAEIAERLRQAVHVRGIDADVEIEETPEGVVLRIRDHALFPTGSADLVEGASELLDRVALVTLELEEPLTIEGHTDDRPIHTSRYPSNWELSSARATSVLRHLIDAGVPAPRLVIAGYADVRPLEPNTTPEGRERNRRVEFLFRAPPDGWIEAQRSAPRAAPPEATAPEATAPEAPAPEAPAPEATDAPEAPTPSTSG